MQALNDELHEVVSFAFHNGDGLIVVNCAKAGIREGLRERIVVKLMAVGDVE